MTKVNWTNEVQQELICLNSYDPYYGFNIICFGEKILVSREMYYNGPEWDTIKMFNASGQFIGSISRHELLQKFR